jgi:hypothetical protein
LNHSDDLLKDSVALAGSSSAPEKWNPNELVIPIVCYSTKEILDTVDQLGIKLDKEVASLTISGPSYVYPLFSFGILPQHSQWQERCGGHTKVFVCKHFITTKVAYELKVRPYLPLLC